MIYLDENNDLLTTNTREEELLYSLLQNLLLRKGEASFYADSGMDWYAIEQGYANIDAELSRIISLFEENCRQISYSYEIVNAELRITIVIQFLNEDIVEKSITKYLGG